MPKTFINSILSLFVLAYFPLSALAGPYGCHDSGIIACGIISLVLSIKLIESIADAIGQACSFATDSDYVSAANAWCMFNANKGVTANNQIWFPQQGDTSWLGMTDSKGRKIAMWGESLSGRCLHVKRNCSNFSSQENSMSIRTLKELSSSIIICVRI